MSLSIRTNVSSLTAQRNLSASQLTLDSALTRLSSGYRITRAGDDAAGLGLSTKLESQIRSYGQATRNANDGLSVVQASEAALNEQANVLTRLRELAMQSASDGVGNSERGTIDTEAGQLLSELQRIAQVTEYNGTKLLDGSNASGLDFQVGIAGTRNDVITLKTVNATTASGGVAGGVAPVLGPAVLTATQAAAAAFNGDPSSSTTTPVDGSRVLLDALAAFNAAQSAAGGPIQGDPYAAGAWFAWAAVGGGSAGRALVSATASGGSGGNALLGSAMAAFLASVNTTHDVAQAQVAAASASNGAAGWYAYEVFRSSWERSAGHSILYGAVAVDSAYAAGVAALGTAGGASGGLGVAGLSLATKASALTALDTIDGALGQLSNDRAQLGASGNRLQSAINDIQAFSESLSAANSRIRDVDVAEETSRLSRAQILAQAGVSVLSQANQAPRLALRLLG